VTVLGWTDLMSGWKVRRFSASHDDPAGEGVPVVVPGIINFNHTGGGEKIYVRTS
jgi:hypothetical protein